MTVLNKEQSLRLDRALNACVRFIFGVSRYEHISPYYRRLGWMRLAQRRSHVQGVFLHSLFGSGLPSYLLEKFECRGATRARPLRAGFDTLTVPIHRTNAYGGSFHVGSVRLWNGLPANLRIIRSREMFRNDLRRLILED